MPEHAFLSRTERSYIDVIMTDGTYHHFAPHVLDVLIQRERVLKFKRTDGWVTPGIDPVRLPKPENLNGSYQGPERRVRH
jgi:hypothetical protein